MLGNPPWDQVQFREQEFFAKRAPVVAAAATESTRKKLISDLASSDPQLFSEYREAMRAVDAFRMFVIGSGNYKYGARGRINTYLLFVECSSQISGKGAGLIVPTGVATDESGRLLFGSLFGQGRIRRLWDFENREGFFPEVDSRARFALLTLGSQSETNADFCFGLHRIDDTAEIAKHFSLTIKDLEIINPNTLTCPSFPNKQVAELVRALHRRLPVLLRESHGDSSSDSWGLVTKPGLLNMASDSRLFVGPDAPEPLFPVYEGKMFSYFDHRFADVVISEAAFLRQGQSEELSAIEHQDPSRTARPRHWVSQFEIANRVRGQWDRKWLAGWKEITSPTNTRTLIPAILPLSGIGHKIPIYLPRESQRDLTYALTASLSSFVCDFVCRAKLNGTSLTPFTFKQLPALLPSRYSVQTDWQRDRSLSAWLLPRALELIFAAWDLESFATDCGWDGPPFRWDEERRLLIRGELDAAFFHLYLPTDVGGQWRLARKADGCPHEETLEEFAELKRHFPTPRSAVAYIMDTFPIVRRKDEERYDGDYRTKRVILEIYDAMQEAIRTGQPYQTRLDPPPGPPLDADGKFVSYAQIADNPPPHMHLPRDAAKAGGAALQLSDLAVRFPNVPFLLRLGMSADAKALHVRPVRTVDLQASDRVVLASSNLRKMDSSVAAAIGKLRVETRTDARDGSAYVLVTVRGDDGIAQARFSDEEWRGLTTIGVVDDGHAS